MKYSFFAIILMLSGFGIFQSCNKITQSTEVSFIEVNARLIDSINSVQLENNELFSSLTSDHSNDADREDLERMRQLVNTLNNSIITVKDHIINSSKHTSDKEAVQKILLEENNANLLIELAYMTRVEVLKLESIVGLQKKEMLPLFPNTYKTPEDKRWDEYNFKNMPLYAVVPIMNRWVLDNERFVNEVLIQ